MATTPYFILSPNTILSAIGIAKRPEPPGVPREDWRQAKVDVVIPALNEAQHISLCLASLLRQTLKPRRIILIDDGSTDGTIEVAEDFCRLHGVELQAIRRRAPIGKTPTLKRQARELDSDVEFILDADTMLESPNYLARTVEELYMAPGVASVCGTILPLHRGHRRQWLEDPFVRAFASRHPEHPLPKEHWLRDFRRGITNAYRDSLYLFLQRFVYRGQTVFFGTISNPVGCAVAYRRKYVAELFDHFEPLLGDDLTNSEDIFIGFAMLDKGYRNVQLTDVYARTVEPEIQRLPRQVYLWSSSFLQSCYYFDPLVKSPMKALQRARAKRKERAMEPPPEAMARPALAAAAGVGTLTFPGGMTTSVRGSSSGRVERMRDTVANPGADASESGAQAPEVRAEQRRRWEPYRQAWGRERTLSFGRPAGWMLMTGAFEKVFFPTTLLIMTILQLWEGMLVTLAAETFVSVAALVAVTRGERLKYLFKGLATTPIRYALLAADLLTLGQFALDIWIRKDKRWRK